MTQGESQGHRLRPFRPVEFGAYSLLLPISTGGMGEIFLARIGTGPNAGELCVIKKIKPHLAEDSEFVQRFVNEARTLVNLSHPNIARIIDMGVHSDAPYIALEYVAGKDLRRVLSRMQSRKLPLPLSFVLDVMIHVLDALAYAHNRRDDDGNELDLVHRDVSPQNVLISYSGEVKVIDFGLAKSSLSSAKTNPSFLLGKFMYMSPEQARHLTVDRRSDFYSVGLCLYELVSSQSPFENLPAGELFSAVGHPSIRPLHTVEPLCPAGLSNIVMKALSIEPENRFETAEAFRDALVEILKTVDPKAGPESTARFMREAFSVEFASDRKMIASVRSAQIDSVHPSVTVEMPSMASSPTPLPFSKHPTPIPVPVGVEPLSFQPTKKVNSLSFEPLKRSEDFDQESVTLPRIPMNAERGSDASTPIRMFPNLLHVAPGEATSPTVMVDASRLMRGEKTDRTAIPSFAKKPTQKSADDRHDLTAITAPPMWNDEPRRFQGRREATTDVEMARIAGPRATVIAERPSRETSPKSTNWRLLPLGAILLVAGFVVWDVMTSATSELRAVGAAPTQAPAVTSSPAPAPVDEGKPAGLSASTRRLSILKIQELALRVERIPEPAAVASFKPELELLLREAESAGASEALLPRIDLLEAKVNAALSRQGP